MIIARTPLRISFAGGGSDLPSFYCKDRAAVLSTSINKYVYLAIHDYFYPNQTLLKYSKTELVNELGEIQHPIFRECLSMLNISGLDISSMADVPAGTGLGSSSSFTVCLLNVLNAYKHKFVSPEYLASTACNIEIKRLGEPIGKQDQYAAAYGGLNFIEFKADESVNVSRIIMDPEAKRQLEKNLVMVYTGHTRSASKILQQQNQEMSKYEKRKIMRNMVDMAYELKDVLQRNEIDQFGRILHEGWLLKQKLSNGISNPDINALYERGLKAGALGGKLLGAGGSGFLLFYCPTQIQDEFWRKMPENSKFDFKFDDTGSKIIYTEN